MTIWNSLPYLSFIINLFLTFYIFTNARKNKANYAYVFFSLMIEIWLAVDILCIHFGLEFIFLIKFKSAISFTIPFFFMNFIYQFLSREKNWLYLLSLVFTIISFFTILFSTLIFHGIQYKYGQYFENLGVFYFPFFILTSLVPIANTLYLIFSSLAKMPTSAHKKQLNLILLGFFCTLFIAILFNLVFLRLLQWNVYPVASSASLILTGFIFVAIFRHNLFRINPQDFAFTLFEQIEDAVLILDERNKIIRTNHYALKLLSIKEEAPLISSIIPFYENFQNQKQFQFSLEQKGLKEFFLASQNTMPTTYSKNGKILIIKKLNDLNWVENELKRKNEELSALIKIFPDIFFVLDSQGLIKNYNPYKSIAFLSKNTLIINESIETFFPSELKIKIKQALWEAGNLKQQSRFEFLLENPTDFQYYEARFMPDETTSNIFLIITHLQEKNRVSQIEINHENEMLFFSHLSLDFIKLSPQINIFNFLAEKLRILIPDQNLILTSYDQGSKTFTIQDIIGIEDMNLLFRLFGKKMLGHQLVSHHHSLEEELIFNELSPLKHNIYEIFPDDFPKFIIDTITRTLGIKEILNIAIVNQEKIFGNILLLSTHKKPYQEKYKSPLEAFCHLSAIGISNHLAQKELYESEKKYRIMADLAPGIIFEIDLEGRFLYLNEAAYDIVGYSKEEVKNNRITAFSLVVPADQERMQKNISLQLKGEAKTNEYRLRKKNGDCIDVILSALPLVENQKISGFRGFAMDISQNKKIREELQEKSQALTLVNQELQKFVYTASHDLKEPLRMVSSYLNLIKNRFAVNMSPSNKELFDFAIDGSLRMQMLLDGLLAYSRVETNGKDFIHFDLKNIRNYLQTRNHNLIETGILQLELTAFHSKVFGDEAQVASLLQLLIDNALKFNHSDPKRIVIIAQEQEKEFIFCVQDNGIGIEKEQSQRIFDIFQKLHPKEAYPGIGLGLALAKRIITRHKGKIWVESQKEQGSSFYFALPKT